MHVAQLGTHLIASGGAIFSPDGGGSTATAYATIDAAYPLSSTTPTFYAGSSCSFSYTVRTGVNLLVLIWHDGGSEPNGVLLSSATYNGEGLTKLTGSSVQIGYEAAEVWYMVNPPVGTYTLACTPTGASGEMMPAVLSIAGANTSSPFGTPVVNSASSSRTATVTGTGASAGGFYICSTIMDCTGIVPTNSQTGAPYGTQMYSFQGDGPPPSKVAHGVILQAYRGGSMSWTGTGSAGSGWVAVAVPVNVGSSAKIFDGAITASAGKFINNRAQTVQMNGINLSGMETGSVQAGAPFANSNWAVPAGYSQGCPDWAWLATEFRPNAIRLPQNAGSFLGLSCDSLTDYSITFATAPTYGGTSGTLNANFVAPSGHGTGYYPVVAFGGGGYTGNPWVMGYFTVGSTAVTFQANSWSGGGSTSTAASVLCWAGSTLAADPGSHYLPGLQAAIDACVTIGCYPILDLHWSQANMTIGGVNKNLYPNFNSGQPEFIDNTGYEFWQNICPWLSSTYGSVPPYIIFELFNEPSISNGGAVYANSSLTGSQLNSDVALGSGGYNARYSSPYITGSLYALSQMAFTYQIHSYQDALNALRTYCNNICVVNGNNYSSQLEAIADYMPTDTLNQTACGVHPYPNAKTGTFSTDYAAEIGGNVYPYNGYLAPNTTNSANVNDMVAVITTGTYPLIATEYGSWGGASATSGEPYVSFMTGFFDTYGISSTIWAISNMPSYGSSVTLDETAWQNSAGTGYDPVPGQGVVFQAWIEPHS